MENNDQFIDTPAEPEIDLNSISKLGIEYVTIRNDIIKLKNMLEQREKAFKHLSEVVIPDVMQRVNMTSFGLANGFKLEVKPFTIVTLPKENADIADTWLDENGHGGMVKHSIDVHLPKGIDADKLHELKAILSLRGFEYADTKSIHYQTLNKWSREMEAEGETIPDHIFKIYRGYKTEIKE